MSMNSSSSKDDRRKKKPPSFSGRRMPMNVNTAGLDEGAPETTRRIGFQPSFEPISSFQPPSLVSSTQYTGASKTAPAAPLQQKGIWKLKEVPTLPEYHPLERTAVFCPHAAPSEVSMRISEVLRERSIEATYEDAKAKVKCVSADGVDFRVRLYRGRGRFDHGVIVEVQRRFGASHTFYSDTMAILDAAEGKVPPPPAFSSSSKMPLVSDEEDDDSESSIDGSSSLVMVSKMLSHPGYDSHYLALQTLSSLTDASKMGAGTAKSVSKELMRNENDVGGKVLSLVIDKKGDDDDMFKLRSIALTVVANAFSTLKGDVPTILKEGLRETLIQELRQATKSPRTAHQAARALEFFVPQDNGSDLFNALETALEAGTARHAALQRQAQVCLDKLA